MQYNPSRYEVDKKTGFFTVGYGYGSSPTFTNVTITGTTDSTSKDTGCLVLEGGLGVEKSATIGGNLTVSGASYLSGNSWFNLGSYSGTRALNFYYTGTNRQAFISSTGGGNFNGDIKFGVNGSGTDTDAVEVARINSVGLHIGPAGNASAPLQIENATTTSSRQAATGLRLSSPAGSGQTTPSIEFTNSVGTGAAIDSIRTAASYASSLRFFTSVAGGDVPTLALTLDSSQNATLTGNLTVSGTGTSTFTGDVSVTRSTGNPTFNLTNGASGGFPLVQFIDQRVGGNNWNIENGRVAGQLGFYSSGGGGTVAAITAGGNLLIGTTTDSANGKLQLATHSSSAGGIGFGTDISAFRATNSILSFVGGQTSFQINLAGSASTAVFGTNATGAFINSAGSTSLVLQTNTTTALTLDSSQRMLTTGMAAFGGTTFLNLASWANGSSGFGENNLDKAVIGHLKSSTNGATIAGHTWPLTGWAPLNIAGTSLTFRTNGELIALTLDSSQRTILSGALRLNNAYTASAVVPTGYVTIQDSTGTTYKVCVLL